MKNISRSALPAALVAAAVAIPLVWASAANADTITIGLQESGVNAGAITSVATGSGTASFSGTYGSFSLNTVTGTGSSFLPAPDLNTNAQDISDTSGVGGTLKVYVTESGLTAPLGVIDFGSVFTSNTLTSGWTVGEATYVGPGNAVFGIADLLSSTTFSTTGTSTQTGLSPNLSAPYSETALYTLVALSGAGSANDTINTHAVPEPGSLLLLGTGLIGFSLFGRRRRRAV